MVSPRRDLVTLWLGVSLLGLLSFRESMDPTDLFPHIFLWHTNRLIYLTASSPLSMHSQYLHIGLFETMKQ